MQSPDSPGRGEAIDSLSPGCVVVSADGRCVEPDRGDGRGRNPRRGESVCQYPDPRHGRPGAARFAAAEHIRHHRQCQSRATQPVCEDDGSHGRGRRQVEQRPAPFERQVEQSQGHRNQGERSHKRPIAVEDERLKPADLHAAAEVRCDIRDQKSRRRDQRIEQPGAEAANAGAGPARAQPKQSDRRQAVEDRVHRMVAEGGRPAQEPGKSGHYKVQQRRVAVLVGDAVVPEREPGEVAPILHGVTADGDVGAFDRVHGVEVLDRSQLARDEPVNGEQRQRAGQAAGRRPKPLADARGSVSEPRP